VYKKILLSIVLLFLATGCSTKKYIPIQNKISSNSDLNREFLEENYVLVHPNCSNTKQRWFVYFFIQVSGYTDFTDEYVIDELLNECGGDIVTNLKVEGTLVPLYIINYYGVNATGDVWRRK